MERSLYEINQELINAIEIDPETGEITNLDKVEALEMERNVKIENVALYIKNQKAMADALKAEETSLANRRKTLERRVDRLTEYLANNLNGQAFETPKVAINYRKSVATECDPEFLQWAIDNSEIDYLKFKAPEVNVSEVKKALKEGVELPFARLVERQNMSIK